MSLNFVDDCREKWKFICDTYEIKDHPKLKRFLIQQVEEWNELVDDVISKTKINFGMEIGTNGGGSFYTLCRFAEDDALLISLDLVDCPYCGLDKKQEVFKKEFAKENQKLHVLHGNSTELETIENIKQILNQNELDYLFIDGDHSYNGVKQDFDNYSPMVRDGGIIVFHDIGGDQECGSAKFWQEIKQDKNSREIFVPGSEKNVMGIGVIYK